MSAKSWRDVVLVLTGLVAACAGGILGVLLSRRSPDPATTPSEDEPHASSEGAASVERVTQSGSDVPQSDAASSDDESRAEARLALDARAIAEGRGWMRKSLLVTAVSASVIAFAIVSFFIDDTDTGEPLTRWAGAFSSVTDLVKEPLTLIGAFAAIAVAAALGVADVSRRLGDMDRELVRSQRDEDRVRHLRSLAATQSATVAELSLLLVIDALAVLLSVILWNEGDYAGALAASALALYLWMEIARSLTSLREITDLSEQVSKPSVRNRVDKVRKSSIWWVASWWGLLIVSGIAWLMLAAGANASRTAADEGAFEAAVATIVLEMLFVAVAFGVCRVYVDDSVFVARGARRDSVAIAVLMLLGLSASSFITSLAINGAVRAPSVGEMVAFTVLWALMIFRSFGLAGLGWFRGFARPVIAASNRDISPPTWAFGRGALAVATWVVVLGSTIFLPGLLGGSLSLTSATVIVSALLIAGANRWNSRVRQVAACVITAVLIGGHAFTIGRQVAADHSFLWGLLSGIGWGLVAAVSVCVLLFEKKSRWWAFGWTAVADTYHHRRITRLHAAAVEAGITAA